MCLENAEVNVNALFPKGCESIVVYKLMRRQVIDGKVRFTPPYFWTRKRCYPIERLRNGLYVSDRKSRRRTRNENDGHVINKGIHVHLKPVTTWDDTVLVQCIAKKKDYVATSTSQKEAVFMKVRFAYKPQKQQ
jgi:hypothetical protein